MREPAPCGLYETLWDWVESSRANKLPDLGRPSVLYPEEVIPLKKPLALAEQNHPNFRKESVRVSKAFVGDLPDGRYWAGEDGTFAVIAPDNKLIWDVSVQFRLPNLTHPALQRAELPPVCEMQETVAVLSYVWESNYYHWLGDVLARVHLLGRCGIPIDKYLICSRESAPFQRETLAMLEIPEHKIMAGETGLHIRAKTLVVPSLDTLELMPLNPHPLPAWAVRFLRSALLPHAAAGEAKGMERIYISRGDAAHRGVTNEREVEKLLASYGFRTIVPGAMTVAEQIRAFAAADIVVGPHGAGLTNLLFCRPGTRVLELFPPNYVNPLYWYMCNMLDLEYGYLIGEGERVPIDSGIGDIGFRVEPVTVDLERLGRMLERFAC
jgi:hypothetical protein